MAREKAAKPSRPSKPAKRDKGEGFWDKPPLLNFTADLLMLFGAVVLIYAVVLAAKQLPVFPLRQVVVLGKLDQVTRTQVEYAARTALNGNFFTVDLNAVRATFEKLPWVRRADVHRRWPDSIELTIEEQVASARWKQADGEYRLVNTYGEVFVAATEAILPVFTGPEGMASVMLSQHKDFSESLKSLGRRPVEVSLSPRQAWQVRLDDGLVLDLGREESKHPVAERLDRFVASYREVREKLHLQPTLIDMRYPNGFALRQSAAAKSS
ncbi:MAG TPA: cell division protein FtsQ/DivIB [Rhodocyclaceae bacterium]